MKDLPWWLPRRSRAEATLSLLLCIGIVCSLILPATEGDHVDADDETLFAIVENDHASPLFSSASAIHILSSASKEIARFAGYDDFYSRFELDGMMSVASVARITVDLFPILGVDFAMRTTNFDHAAVIYISESFWDSVLKRRADILGLAITLHQTIYRIAGVTRPFEGLLAGTDLWMPISSRSELGAVNCMRVVGALQPGGRLEIAHRELTNDLLRLVGDEASSDDISRAKLVPIARSITFRPTVPIIAAAMHQQKRVEPAANHHTAAFPLSRGS